MVCIYCGYKTRVTNSRSAKRLLGVWRRRECLRCHSLFSTVETPDYWQSFKVRDGSLEPFLRDKLFLSIHEALGHRKTAIEDARAVTDTALTKLLDNKRALLDAKDIRKVVYACLKRFDRAAAVQYAAYYPLP